MAIQGHRDRTDRGSVLIPTLVATLVGAVLAVGGAVVLVQSQSDSDVVAPLQQPLITYDQP
jgi:hypothetical protein